MRKPNKLPSKDKILTVLEYRDGALFWKAKDAKTSHDRAWNTRFAGERAGYLKKDSGYTLVKVGEKSYMEHRLIFFIHHGFVPDEVDHINRVRCDNRIENLRETTRAANIQNSAARRGLSHYRGVHRGFNTGKWVSQIVHDGKKINIGHFDTEIEAAFAYNKEAVKRYGEHAYTNDLSNIIELLSPLFLQALIDADWAVKCSGLEDYKAKASACFLAKAMLKQILEEK